MTSGEPLVPSRWGVFGRAMGILGLWHLVPIGVVAIGWVAVKHESMSACGVDSCVFNGLFLVIYLGVVAGSLLVSTVLVAVLSAVGRPGSLLRRWVFVGHIGSLPVTVAFLVAVPGLIVWSKLLLREL
jgi:hypothetical protein